MMKRKVFDRTQLVAGADYFIWKAGNAKKKAPHALNELPSVVLST
jgi:hypothetical protein